jgi:hypothetical protein
VHVRTRVEAELYEAAGWKRIGTATVHLPDRAGLDEFVYLGPERARRSDVERTVSARHNIVVPLRWLAQTT